jgi:hypothetical protein
MDSLATRPGATRLEIAEALKELTQPDFRKAPVHRLQIENQGP